MTAALAMRLGHIPCRAMLKLASVLSMCFRGIAGTGVFGNVVLDRLIPLGSGDEYAKTIHELQDATFLGSRKINRHLLGTMTTFLSRLYRMEGASRALESIEKHEVSFKDRLNMFVIVNEVPDHHGSLDSAKLEELKETFKWARFVQKGTAMAGHANSLNLIKGLLQAGAFEYWLQFEESWYLTRPITEYAIQILANNRELSMLSLVEDTWESQGVHHIKVETGTTCYIEQIHPSHNDRNGFVEGNFGSCEKPDISRWYPNFQLDSINFDWSKWPLFSLRPAMHRVEHILRSGDFDNESSLQLWGGIFELKFAIHWYCQGGTRAKLCDAAVFRNQLHSSCFDVEFAAKLGLDAKQFLEMRQALYDALAQRSLGKVDEDDE